MNPSTTPLLWGVVFVALCRGAVFAQVKFELATPEELRDSKLVIGQWEGCEDEASLEAFRGSKVIETLILDYTKLSNMGIRLVAEIPSLRKVVLERIEGENINLKPLSKLPKLEYLCLGYNVWHPSQVFEPPACSVKDETLKSLVDCKNLSGLRIY
ncbi:MAG: hypothetical protein N2C14_10265, partial [Planctomycetales bacterium]